jgi:hypothetical protein
VPRLGKRLREGGVERKWAKGGLDVVEVGQGGWEMRDKVKGMGE